MIAICRSKSLVIACLICTLVIQFPWHSNCQCHPSSCGSIHNISYPFRLSTDPEICGHPDYLLICEDQNRTVLTLPLRPQQKYYVQAINYDNYTIRVVDHGVQENNTCSFPQYALAEYSFTYHDPYGFYFINGETKHFTARPINFFSCPFPMNSSDLVQTSNQCSARNNNTSLYSSGGYAYAKLGQLAASDLRVSCRVDLITMTSWRIQDIIAQDNVTTSTSTSLLEIHDALMYGFELSWLPAICYQHCRSKSCYLNDTTNEVMCNAGKTLEILIGITLELLIFEGTRALEWIATINIGARIVIGMPCVFVFLIYKLRRRHLSVFDAIENFLSNTENNIFPIRYSYTHVKNMTKGFKEKLGEGGFGCVYKGKLRSGRDVAVKIINKPKSNGQDFINEVGSLGRIHHVNVVRLVGYCAGNSKRALVYDFMPNGSLDKYIINQGEISGTSLLSWEKKFEIVVGVARGIEYLHRGCDIQILHFDIKPHNILLDENFVPKISDFGLAKLFPTDKNVVTLTAARGTIGYVAPELINRSIGAISHKADVYSFGMLLMEMLGLKNTPIAEKGESSKYFPSWIYNDINKGKKIELGEEDEEQKRITKKMTIVGLWCIQTNPIPRPSMSRVVEMLESDVELLEMPPETFFSEPIVEVDQENSSMADSSESIAFLGNSTTSFNGIEIIVD